MTRKPVPGEKALYWIGSSLKDITRFPYEVQRTAAFALSAAQYGGKAQHRHWIPRFVTRTFDPPLRGGIPFL